MEKPQDLFKTSPAIPHPVTVYRLPERDVVDIDHNIHLPVEPCHYLPPDYLKNPGGFLVVVEKIDSACCTGRLLGRCAFAVNLPTLIALCKNRSVLQRQRHAGLVIGEPRPLDQFFSDASVRVFSASFSAARPLSTASRNSGTTV